MTHVSQSFFERPLLVVARELVGCTLEWGGCAGMIVEVEAYAALDDPACHTMTRPSAREFVTRHPAGTAYVYLNYGMYWLLNVLVKGGGQEGLILLRALEPTGGVGEMRRRRGKDRLEELCSGPGKLGMALGVTRADHGCSLVGGGAGSLPRAGTIRGVRPRAAAWQPELVEDRRIGISRAIEYPWRFSIRGNPHVSLRPSRCA